MGDLAALRRFMSADQRRVIDETMRLIGLSEGAAVALSLCQEAMRDWCPKADRTKVLGTLVAIETRARQGGDFDVEPAVLDGLPRARQGSEVLEEALTGMVQQFADWSERDGGYWSGGLSALEDAFDALGWDDPHPAPEACCDEPGCMDQATCGWSTRPGGTGLNGGYRRTCGDHMRAALAAPEMTG